MHCKMLFTDSNVRNTLQSIINSTDQTRFHPYTHMNGHIIKIYPQSIDTVKSHNMNKGFTK